MTPFLYFIGAQKYNHVRLEPHDTSKNLLLPLIFSCHCISPDKLKVFVGTLSKFSRVTNENIVVVEIVSSKMIMIVP